MATAKRQTITVFRKDPLFLALSVVGYDLSDATLGFSVRQYPDAPGSAILALINAAAQGDGGCFVVDVQTDGDGVPTSLVEIYASKSAMTAVLPDAGEAGADLTLAYDLQWLLPSGAEAPFSTVEQTILFGDFIVRGSVND